MIKYLKSFQCIILFQVVFSPCLLSQLVKNLDKFIHTSKTGDLDTGYPNALATYKTEFYEDGTKYSEGYYENGLMNGSWIYYYTNAAVKAKGKFLHGNGGNRHKVSEIPQNGRGKIPYVLHRQWK